MVADILKYAEQVTVKNMKRLNFKENIANIAKGVVHIWITMEHCPFSLDNLKI